MSENGTEPPPGHPDAVAKGCVCPVRDNANGAGVYIGKDNQIISWFSFSCPLHGNSDSVADDYICHRYT